MMKIEREENPFEEPDIAQAWVQSVEQEKGEFRDLALYPYLKTWLDASSISRVIDIGAGQGIASSLVGDRGYLGVEPSLPLVERAKEMYGQKRAFLVGDAYKLPVADDSFDGALSLNVWFHLADLSQAAREMARVLRVGGSFLIITANPEAYDQWKAFCSNAVEDDKRLIGRVQIPNATLNKSTFYKHSNNEINEALAAAKLQVHQMDALYYAPNQTESVFRAYSGVRV